MKNLIILSILLFTNSANAQGRSASDYKKVALSGLTFKSSYNVFSELDRAEYILEDFENLETGFSWGNFISFEESTFHTYYSAPCGNDCFTSVDGTYKFIGSDRIQVYVNTINRGGFCQLKSEEPKKIIGIYKIDPTTSGLRLTKE